MIPKIIHFCWLGGNPYPELIQRCIDSWHRVLPDYEIMLWNEQTFDTNSLLWVKQAIENKKYAFAADYIRFWALYNYGGIYLDTDVEVLKSFTPLLDRKEFLCEDFNGDVESGIMGVEKGSEWVRKCMEYYHTHSFVKEDGTFNTWSVNLIIDNSLVGNNDVKLLPMHYFSPKDFNLGKVFLRDETYCIHHFTGTWINRGSIFRLKIALHRLLHLFFGRKGHNKIVHRIRKTKGLVE